MEPSVQRQVTQSFEREAFKKVFGSELNELSLKDGFQMSYLLMQAEQAPAQSLDVARVQAQNEAATADLNQLNSLAAQANQSDVGRDPDLLAQARKAVQTQVNRYFDTALQRKVSEAQGVAGYRWLQAWPQDYGVLLALVPPQQAKDSQALVTARMQSLSRATLAAERTRYSLEVAALPHGQQPLVAGKAFDRERAQRHQKDLAERLTELSPWTGAWRRLPQCDLHKRPRSPGSDRPKFQ